MSLVQYTVLICVDLTKENSQSKHDRASSGKNQNNGVKITTLATNSEGEEVKHERKCCCCSGVHVPTLHRVKGSKQ